MNQAKRRLLQERLSGIEFRNQQRAARRRAFIAASLQRQRAGTQRTYEAYPRRMVDERTLRPTSQAAAAIQHQGGNE